VHIAHLRAGLLATAPRISILFNTATPFFVIKTRTTHWCSLLLRRKSTVPPSTESRAAINKLIFENRVPLIYQKPGLALRPANNSIRNAAGCEQNKVIPSRALSKIGVFLYVRKTNLVTKRLDNTEQNQQK
jgi:hypothetical protein